jgi:hypothetical protein
MLSVSVRVIVHLTARPWRKGTMEIMVVLEALRLGTVDLGNHGEPGALKVVQNHAACGGLERPGNLGVPEEPGGFAQSLQYLHDLHGDSYCYSPRSPR